MADRCFRAAWPPGHVNFRSERHFLTAGAAGHGIAAFRPLVPARAVRREQTTLGARGRQSRLAGKVETTMAHWTLQGTRGGAIGYVGAAVLASALGMASLIGPAAAQTPAPAPKKPPAAAPAQKGAPAAAAPTAAQSAWVKLCEKATAVSKDKDGKEQKKDLNICLTHHERLDGNSGMVLVSAAVRQVEGQDKQHFMVMVPLGMLLQAGMRATLYP